jgi:hypothetical protein
MLKEYLLSYRKTITSHLIAFAFGFAIATLIIINIGSDEKYTETDLKRAEKVGEARIIESDLKDAKLMAKEYKIRDSINMIIIDELQKELQLNNKGKNEKINGVDFYTDFELQKFFAERYSSSTPK